MRIIELTNEYKEKTIKLIIDVAIEEYGFHEWRDEALSFENEFYINNNGNCWIAIEQEEVVGTISLRKIDNNIGEVKNLYVHSKYRKQKIAQLLLDKLIDFSVKNGYSKLQLDTYDKFESAINFYHKNGFERIHTINDMHIYNKLL